MSTPTTTKRRTSPPVCPECDGRRVVLRVRAFTWAIGLVLVRGEWPAISVWRVPIAQPACRACGGAGQVPAKLARIADPKTRRESLNAYRAAAPWN